MNSRGDVYDRGAAFIQVLIRVLGLDSLHALFAELAASEAEDVCSLLERRLGSRIEEFDEPSPSLDLDDLTFRAPAHNINIAFDLLDPGQSEPWDLELINGARVDVEDALVLSVRVKALILAWLREPASFRAFELWGYSNALPVDATAFHHLGRFWGALAMSFAQDRMLDGRTFLSLAASELEAALSCRDAGPSVFLAAAEFVRRSPPPFQSVFHTEAHYRELAMLKLAQSGPDARS